MSTLVFVRTYAHSVTFVTDKMLTSLKRIVVWSRLDPRRLTDDWNLLDRGIGTWLRTQHLKQVTLEVRHGSTQRLVGRWDFDISYGLGMDGEGEMWTDPDAIRYAIEKCGLNPAECDYRIVAVTKPGRPEVDGWGPATLLSTDGLVRHSVGTTIGADPLSARSAYWRRR